MSTSTKDENKPSILDELIQKQALLSAEIKKAKDSLLEGLHAKLKEAHTLVQSLTEQISQHSDKPAPAKRGRKPKNLERAMRAGSKTKAPKKAKGKRGSVGEAITAFVTSKGKAGAHVKDIAAATGNKPANVTAFFYSKGGKAKFKNLGSATFALKK